MKKVSHTRYGKPAGLLAALLLLFSAAAYAQTNYYVAKTGNDGQIGLSPALAKLTIQNAINAAFNGDTINVGAGDYPENITVDRRLVIRGAGSSVAGTIISGGQINTPVVNIIANGLDAANGLMLMALRVTGGLGGGNAGSGIQIAPAIPPAQFLMFDDVNSSANSGHGLSFNYIGAANDISVSNCELSSNGNTGLRVATSITLLDGLSITGGSISDNAVIGLSVNPSISNASDATNISISGTTFSGNGTASFAGAGLGFGDISFTGVNGNVALTNVTVTGLASNGAHIGIQFRGHNTPAASGTITLNNVTLTGSYRRPSLAGSNPGGPGVGMLIQNYTDVSAVSFNNVSINTTDGSGIELSGLSTSLNLGITNVHAQNGNAASIRLGTSTQNPVTTNADATGASFNGVAAATATLPQLFAIEDKILHLIDVTVAGIGFVKVKNGNYYVTTNSFLAPTSTSASIQRAINAAVATWVVNVANGTYNEDININKSITVSGESQSAIIRGLYSGAGDAVFMGTSNCTLSNVTVTRDFGATLTDWNNCTKNQGINIQQTSTGVTIHNVRLHGNRNAIFCNNAQNVTITYCTVEDNRTGLHFGNNVSGLVVHSNMVRNNFTHGVLFNYDLAVTITATNAQVTNNSITGNWYSQVNFQRNSGGAVTGDHSGLSFACNWYGTPAPQAVAASAAEPGYVGQVPSQFGGTDPNLNRQLYGTEIARCPYTPWLIDGTDNNPSLPGFQPVTGSCLGNNNTPAITCPSNIAISCTASTDPSNTGSATAANNCGGTTVSYTDVITPGYCPCDYTITRTWKATDGCNNQNTCDQIITVQDLTPPVVSGCPSNITLTGCNQTATWTAPTATTTCGGPITTTSTHNPGATFPAGTTTVTYTFKDANNVSSTCSFTVTVSNSVTPGISGCPPNKVVSTGPGNTTCSATATWTAPFGFSNCGNGPVTVTSSHASGSSFPVGVTTVTYTFTDTKNNSTTCSFTVTVNDNTKPLVTGCPGNMVVQTGPGNPACSQTATWTPPTATDNCGGSVTTTASHAPGSVFPVGSTQVVYTFKDALNNTSTCYFYVTVVDNTPPVITSPCPSDITVFTGPGNTSCRQNATWAPPTGTDNCGTVNRTSNQQPGASFNLGTTPVTYTFKDAKNNTTTCSFNVTVADNTPPVALCKNYTLTLTGSGGTVTPANIDNGSSDNCGIVSRTVSPNTFTCAQIGGTYPVVLTVTDASGNSATCTAMVTVTGDCGSFSARLVKGEGSNGGGIADEVKVYPNPNNGAFIVELPAGAKGQASITVSDVQGKMIMIKSATDEGSNKVRLDLGDVARGMYFVEVVYGDHRFRTKMNVQ